MMRILLINPSYKQGISNKYEKYFIRSGSRWPHSAVKRKGVIPHYLPFPFSLAYSASLLKEAFFDVYAMDAVALDISEETLLFRIGRVRPHLIFYEITTVTLDYDLLLAKQIKELSNSTIAVGGAHASVFASAILLENEAIDFILKGEYEYSLLELAKSVKQNEHEVHNFPSGLVFRHEGKIIDNGDPFRIKSLDSLPFPRREIFPANDSPDPTVYWDGFCQHRPMLQLQSSRGCAYKCYFCLFNQVIYSNGKYRSFSVKRIVDEMQEAIAKYRVKEIYFDDDNFTQDKNRILSICEEILKRKLKTKWSCMTDAINLTEPTLRIMAQSGCVGIKFGVESGSEKVLKGIGKPIDLKKVKPLLKSCRQHRIKTQATFMVGLLGETKDDLKKTIRFADSLDVDTLQISIATPLPGTEFFKIAKEKGFLKDATAWAKFDGKACSVIYFPDGDGVSLENIKRRIFFSWLLKKFLFCLWRPNHLYILFRTLKGLGPNFFLKQIISVIIDEWKNR